jgi:broad specificity phosphatase PhoE
MREHEKIYKTLSAATDKDYCFIRIEEQRRYNFNNINGTTPSKLAYLLHNLRHSPVDLYITRSGEYSEVEGRLGGNSSLTERGKAYSRALFEFMQQEVTGPQLVVMSSSALRCVQTVASFVDAITSSGCSFFSHSFQISPQTPLVGAGAPFEEQGTRFHVGYYPTLCDINHGDCEGQLIADIQKMFPNTIANIRADPYHIAWPSGESIEQVFTGRLEPHIHEIQASLHPVLIVSHTPILQGLYAYFVSTEDGRHIQPEDAPSIDIPMHSVIRIRHRMNSRHAQTFDLSERVREICREQELELSMPQRSSPMVPFKKKSLYVPEARR